MDNIQFCTIQDINMSDLKCYYLYMESESSSSKTITCQFCRKQIPHKNKYIHQSKCFQNKSTRERKERSKKSSTQTMRRSGEEKRQRREETCECPFCSEHYPISQVDSHASLCPFRQVPCERCDCMIKSCYYDEHLRNCNEIVESQCINQEENEVPVLNRRVSQQISSASLIQSQNAEMNGGDNPDNNQSSVIERQQDSQSSQSLIQMILSFSFGMGMGMETIFLMDNVFVVSIQLQAREANPQVRGLTAEQIDRINNKVYRVKEGEEIEMCSICYTDLADNEQLKDIQCRHLFHTVCLAQWLKINKTCPNCKRNISPEREEAAEEVRESQESQPQSSIVIRRWFPREESDSD